jgi:hypothetical protein
MPAAAAGRGLGRSTACVALLSRGAAAGQLAQQAEAGGVPGRRSRGGKSARYWRPGVGFAYANAMTGRQ